MDAALDNRALQQRIDALNGQVKLLVRTEKRLYATQREVGRQIRRIEALNQFALVAPASTNEATILGHALDMIAASLPVHGALAVVVTEGGALVPMLRESDGVNMTVEPDDDLRDALASVPLPEDVEVLGDPADCKTRPLVRWLDARVPGHGAAEGRRAFVLFSLRGGSTDGTDFVLVRSETVSFHEQVAGEPDRVFLRLARRHIENALTIARSTQVLEQRVRRRTRELGDANEALEARLAELRATQQQLVAVSRKAGMAEVATSVLHNVGNVLNSVNVSAELVATMARSSRCAGLARAMRLLHDQRDPRVFLAEERGATWLGYMDAGVRALGDERERMLCELTSLAKNIEHIKAIVTRQQSHATARGLIERFMLETTIDDALGSAACQRLPTVEVVGDVAEGCELHTDRHKLVEILVNLLSNAFQAVRQRAGSGRVVVRGGPLSSDAVEISVSDDGVGIAPDLLERIFTHGFTTKLGGHGFGLHASACAALELGGSLQADSDGPGRGATFRLVLPRRHPSASEEPT
jgi:signal transduction histidine kinase